MSKTLLTVLEMVGIIGLASLGIKAENERHKTKLELLDTQIKLSYAEIHGAIKDAKIQVLETEINRLKSKEESEESN